MRIKPPNFTRQQIIVITMMAMIVNLFTARGLLSISMILFIAATSVHINFRDQVMHFLKDPLLVSIALLFFIPFLSGLWSTDIHKWSEVVQLKVPLLVLPIAFGGSWQLNNKQWQWITALFLLCVVCGTVWSFLQYLQNTEVISQGYLRAKAIPTPLENDHVRFSWLVSIAALVSGFLLPVAQSKKLQLLLAILTTWLVIYLHILSVRTGLVCLYMGAFIYLLHLLVSRLKQKLFLYILPIMAMPLLAWALLPTFRNRIHYFVYDFSYVKSSTYLPGANDGNRVLSLKAGLDIMAHHPFGTGAGDVERETLNWYAAHVPNMLSTDKLLLPSSEWIIYGAAAGWPGLIIFTGIMLVPLFLKTMQARWLWLSITGTAAFSLLFDIGLEVQFGVFLYAFIILSCYKVVSPKIVTGNE